MRALLIALLLAPACAEAARARKARPSRPLRPAAAAPAAPAAEAERPRPADAALFAFGVELDEGAGGLDVLAVRPSSRAEALGLRPGDRLMSLDGRPASGRAQAAAALRERAPGVRLSALVRRGGEIRALESAPPARPLPLARGAGELSARERAAARRREGDEREAAEASVRAAPSPAFTARADQSLWVRFPAGLSASVRKGDVVVAEVSTALTTDASLDFLSVPPKSRIWARVVESAADGETRAVRLAFFKLAAAGGGAYPVSGVPAGVSGDQTLARVSSGGTLVVAAPFPGPDGERPWPDLLDPEARLRVRLLEPLTLVEPPSYWRAGPGLWLRTAEREGSRLFEVSHVTPGRAAHAAGLKAGDLVEAIDGRGSSRLDFTDALDRLYGKPGSELGVTMLSRGKSAKRSLKRGARFDGGAVSALPLPVKY